MKYKRPIRERLLENIEIVTESGCWIWMSVQNQYGYGAPSIRKKKIGAHRLSYAEFVGEIPEGMCVCHRCDVPACINPDHLFLGTHKENMIDRGRKGRGIKKGTRLGENNPAAKLTNKQALEIKKSIEPNKILAEKYGIAEQTVAGIKSGKTWSHLNG